MVAKYLPILVTLAALAAKGGAQGLNVSRPADFVLTPSDGVTAETNPPLFLRSINEAERARQRQGVARGVKECPMPVHRPDTSRLIRMPNVHLSPSVTDLMPRFELNCPNPLDPGRHVQRSPHSVMGYPKEF